MTDFHIIIPARFSSQRLPGKMLADISGKPLIQRVYENALTCGAKSVHIATDDERIASVIKQFGGQFCMTLSTHNCGTERLSEAATLLGFQDNDIIVNIQGDEPLIPSSAVQELVNCLIENSSAAMSTLCTPILQWEELFDPNAPKVVFDKNKVALYFSRSPIPCDRNTILEQKSVLKQNLMQQSLLQQKLRHYYRHIGLYAYRAKTLHNFVHWGAAPIEELEMLEQLRVLWQGEKIQMAIINERLPAGIDTEEDLKRVRDLFAERAGDPSLYIK